MKYVAKWVFIVSLALSTGCAAATITAAGASLGITYSLTNIAAKTFNFTVPEVDKATAQALKKMAIKITEHYRENGKLHYMAVAKDRDIRVSIEPITATTTQIQVDARTWPFFKDKATATEIIYQIFKILEPCTASEAEQQTS